MTMRLKFDHYRSLNSNDLDDCVRACEGRGPGTRVPREAWRRLVEPLADAWPRRRHDVLAPPHLPRHPLPMAKFGLHAIRSARALAEAHFRGPRARALFAGLAAHSALPLEARPSAAIGLILAIGLGRLAQSLLYQLKGYDPLVLIGATVTLAVVAAAAGTLPAYRASRVDPAQALRFE